MNIMRQRSVATRIKAIEAELSEHTRALVSLDMYLVLLETALLMAKVFTKDDLNNLREEVLKKNARPDPKKIITL